jgi:hypothetical protein
VHGIGSRMKPQVFISHTDGEDPDAQAFRALLSRGLADAGFDPVLDQERNELGDLWRRQLLVWMLGCHAGLILLTKKAIEGTGTPWMQFETTVLVMLRTRSEIADDGAPAFPIIPVLVPPVRPEDIQGSWLGPLALDEIQSGRASAALVKRVVASLAKRGLKESLADSPLQALQSVVRPWLRKVDRDVVLATGKALGADTTTWTLDDAPDRLVRELLKADLDGVGKAMTTLAPQLPDHAQQLLDILAAAWVDPEAAAKLPPIARSTRRVAGINAKWTKFTGDSYVRRAWARHPPPAIVYVTESGERDVEGAAREIFAAIRERNPKMDLATEQDVVDFMAAVAGDTAFHVGLSWVPEPPTVTALSARFPDATFLCLAADEGLGEIGYLTPEIEAQCENKAYFSYLATHDLVGRA